MSLRLRFSDQARIELSEIWDYIAEYNEKAADQRIERIVAACQAFTHTPELAATVKSFGWIT